MHAVVALPRARDWDEDEPLAARDESRPRSLSLARTTARGEHRPACLLCRAHCADPTLALHLCSSPRPARHRPSSPLIALNPLGTSPPPRLACAVLLERVLDCMEAGTSWISPLVPGA